MEPKKLTQHHYNAIDQYYIIAADTVLPETDFIGVRPLITENLEDYDVEFLVVDTENSGIGRYTTLSPEDAIEFATHILKAAELAIRQREDNRAGVA